MAEDLERWSKLYYVGADAFDSGRLEGALAADAFLTDDGMDRNQDEICQYVVLEGEAGHQDAIVRTECSVNMLLESGVQVEDVYKRQVVIIIAAYIEIVQGNMLAKKKEK